MIMIIIEIVIVILIAIFKVVVVVAVVIAVVADIIICNICVVKGGRDKADIDRLIRQEMG